MKLGTTVSSAAHIGILSWGLLVLDSQPEEFKVELNSVQVEVVLEDNSNSAVGEKKANVTPKPAPKATKKPPVNAQAQNIGDSELDVKSQVDVPQKPKPVEVTPPPPAAKIREAVPNNEPQPQPVEAEKETPVPTNELASLNEPPSPLINEKLEEIPTASDEDEVFIKLPDKVPLPVSRPKPPEAKTARTKERKKPDEIKKAIKRAKAKDKEKSAEDKIAALLNKQQPVASGSKRSTRKVSLGSKKSSSTDKLSRNELDALRGAIEQCWNVPIGLSDAEDMRVTITMNLSRDGEVDGRVKVKASGGESRTRRTFAESARRAVLKCAPYDLPNTKYDTWSQVIVNFDPSQMF